MKVKEHLRWRPGPDANLGKPDPPASPSDQRAVPPDIQEQAADQQAEVETKSQR